MAGIFISYRRADSDGWAGRLRDALRVRFGDIVFQDVDNIADGEIFSDVIDRALQACEVALIIIGPTWGSARDEQGRRRLDLEDDWVRTETGMVLNRKIRVIPVLVGGARLPRADELPEELRSLTKRQAREIRSTSWDSDVAQLASHLEQIVGRPRRKLWLYAAPAVVAAAAAGVFFGSRFFDAADTQAPIAEEVALAPAAPKAQPADSPPLVVTPPQKSEKHASEAAVSAEKARAPTLAHAEKGRASAAASEKTERSVSSAPAKSPSGAKDSAATAEPAAKPQAPVATRTEAPARPEPPTRNAEAPPRRAAKDASADAQPPAAKPPPVAPKLAAAPAEPAVQPGRRAAPAAPTLVNPDPPPASRSEVASAPPAVTTAPPAVASAPPAVASAPRAPASTPAVAPWTPPTPKPSPEPAKAAEAAAEAPAAARSPTPAPAATGVTAGAVARVVPISLPNRPASARELKVGDSWTYRLRDLAYNKELATATHEVRGGDTSGIREVIRVGERKSDGESGGTQRRLPLEARVFEQPLGQAATLFEFAPFLIAFSDVRPGLAWSEITVGGSDDWRMSGKVTGHERIRTPAGSFEAIKAEIQGRRDITFPTTRDVYYETSPSRMTYAIWYVPEIGRAVKYDRRTFNRASRLLEHEQYELVSYQLK